MTELLEYFKEKEKELEEEGFELSVVMSIQIRKGNYSAKAKFGIGLIEKSHEDWKVFLDEDIEDLRKQFIEKRKLYN